METIAKARTQMVIFALLAFWALIAAVVLAIILIVKKEKRRQMKKTKISVVISVVITALLVPAAAAAVMFYQIQIDSGEGITYFLEDLPDLRGRLYEECKEEYSDKFELVVQDKIYSFEDPVGVIIDQYPMEGFEYLPGNGDTTVKCIVSKGVRIFYVADVVGLDFDDAKEILEENTFKVGFVSEYSEDVPKGKVIATDPPAFEKAAGWSAVKVTVSGGKEPDVTNDNE